MTSTQLGQFLAGLALLLLLATVLGRLFARFHQPKVVGEILAGVVLGPSLLGAALPQVSADVFGSDGGADDYRKICLGLIYNLGLLLLMFVSGTAVRNVLGRENRKQTAWILGIGTPLPFFLTLLIATQLPLDALMGTADSRSALVLLICSATAVTSIPVITKIFADLGILHTRFASLLLGSAVLEDIMLWGVVSIATALAASSATAGTDAVTSTVTSHVLVNVAYGGVAFLVMPGLLARIGRARWNGIARDTPVTWALLVFLFYVAVASALDVTLAFAAFLAGFGLIGGIKGSERTRFRAPMESLSAVAHSFFIPLYFAIVGLQLDFGKSFSLPILAAFLFGSSALAIGCGALAARLAGFRGVGIVNLAITTNARGGPGILLASVGYSEGIISQGFFTALVLTAVLTSQFCGAWLGFVLRRNWSLLGETPEQEAEWAASLHEDMGLDEAVEDPDLRLQPAER